MSGKSLAALFDTWLFQPSKPAASAAKGASLASRTAAATVQPRSWKKIAATNSAHQG
uniref:Uncharacterized protein n=1 Tax=Streptomyces avermitilis TaxID=33903 RepID=A0A499V518_STRAX|nr:hypothetical protein SAVMC3_20030 [Streptomyces avermitilis]